jgi:hypothetical protein
MHDFDLSGLAFASADTLAGNAEKIRKAIV